MFEGYGEVIRRYDSFNDHPIAREAFAGFQIEEVGTTYTIASAGNGKRAGALIISNQLRRAGTGRFHPA